MENKRNVWSSRWNFITNQHKKKFLKIMDNKRFRIAEIFKSLEQDMVKIG